MAQGTRFSTPNLEPFMRPNFLILMQVREDSEEHSMEDREDGGCETSKKRKEPLDLDDGLVSNLLY